VNVPSVETKKGVMQLAECPFDETKGPKTTVDYKAAMVMGTLAASVADEQRNTSSHPPLAERLSFKRAEKGESKEGTKSIKEE